MLSMSVIVVKSEMSEFCLTSKTYLIFMFGYHDEMNYSERRYQQTIDDCKYSAQYFNAVAICPFTKGKIICPKLFSKHFIFRAI